MIDPLTVLLVALALVLVRGVVQVRALRAQASQHEAAGSSSALSVS